MDDRAPLPFRERLAGWLEALSHVLPAQAPIRDFVHHNTLHGFQHLPFAEALTAAERLTGARCFWPEARFQAAYASGRINDDDLLAALEEVAPADLETSVAGCPVRDLLRASLLIPVEVDAETHLAWADREGLTPADRYWTEAARLVDELSAPASVGDGDWRPAALLRWHALCDRVGRTWTLRSLLDYLSGEDVLESVRTILQRHLASYLDLGVGAWANPHSAAGFYAAWRASAGCDLGWEIDDQHSIRDEICHLPADALDVLAEELARQVPDEDLWPAYLERLALELPGWSGMFLWQAQHRQTGPAIRMADYLAVRIVLERLLSEDVLRRLTGAALSLEELRGYYAVELAEFHVRDAWRQGRLDEALLQQALPLLEADDPAGADDAAWEALAEAVAAQPTASLRRGRTARLAGLLQHLAWPPAAYAALSGEEAGRWLACAEQLTAAQRGEIWLLAYERHYREQLFGALQANRTRSRSAPRPSAQVVMCMDDREEGTRRHLEELAPEIETYGAAGFFGVPMYWQGIDDEAPAALCPVVVTPAHLVREHPASDAEAAAKHARRRSRRLRWRERLYQATRRDPLAGPLLAAAAGLPALVALTAATLAPGWFGNRLKSWRERYEGRGAGTPAVTATAPAAPGDGPQVGFSESEQIERVEGFLRMIGLTEGFAPLVLLLGHGSGSRNNPHLSAYDCGACSGRHGGPNARVFAAMANRPAVRAGLLARGLRIPAETWFVAAEHNTCDDGVEWYDLEAVPAAWQSRLDQLLHQLREACRAHAAERCRRLASAPVRPTPWQGRRHVSGRAHDISQARPELGHATNAAAFIGRRQMSRGLFLDRRVFLVSYDPLTDASGEMAERILLAAGPVGAGIALEYYFSSVDNERFGCGSKVTHNLTGLFGVMEGADSDLRTGLPWQMVEIHEPMRLLVVVEQTPAVLTAVIERQPPLRELIDHAWIVLAACHPDSGALSRYCPRRGWLPWSGSAVLPQVARSADWFAGETDALPPALVLGAAAGTARGAA